MLFKPTFWIENVLRIDRAFLTKHNLKGLILDLDNTLSMHGNPAEEAGVLDWLREMRAAGTRMIVVSNNTAERVTPLAQKLALPFISFGCKPLPFKINRAAKQLRLPKSEIAVVGDQIFTDVLGGNLSGMRTILVEPFHLEIGWTFRLKRKLEQAVFHRDYGKLERK